MSDSSSSDPKPGSCTDDQTEWRWARHWNADERAKLQRVERRFRHHVRTPSNPTGRIHRECCVFHPEVPAEAHHLDYDEPFVVVWLCVSCHRKVEHGTLRLQKKHIWDYSSLVVTRPNGWSKRTQAEIDTAKGKDVDDGSEVPF